ncbi:MAG TPA: hypothetical protein VFE15_02780 [Marmoricola sp.]|jgi:hypothetical protein|nr:hypothetical protein [Marmoricola sp.]
MSDPTRDLENFGTGGIVTTPLPPSEVRRLGDRRRTRRRTTTAVASFAVLAAVAVPFALTNHGGADGSRQVGPATTSPSTSPTPTPKAPPAVITYPDPGIEVSSPQESDKLVGTSVAFQKFIGDQARRAVEDGSACPDAAHGVTVQKYSSSGYAIGGVNSCGGYEALWVRSNGVWAEGQGTQDIWDCDALTYLHVPTSFTGPCGNESGDFGLPGAGGPEPGMSASKLHAAGLVLTDPKRDPPCSGVVTDSPTIPTDGEGLYSPTDGLVQVYATTLMMTEKSVGLGTLRSKVRAAYPDGQGDGGSIYTVPRPGGTVFLFRFDAENRVQSLSWQLKQADCADYLM